MDLVEVKKNGSAVIFEAPKNLDGTRLTSGSRAPILPSDVGDYSRIAFDVINAFVRDFAELADTAEVTIEFGIKLAGEAGFVVGKVSLESTFVVKATFKEARNDNC